MEELLIVKGLNKLQAKSADLTEELNIRLTELYKWYNRQLNAISDDRVAILNDPASKYRPTVDIKQLSSRETTDAYVRFPEEVVDIELSLQSLTVKDEVINIENSEYGTKSWPGFWLNAFLGCKTSRLWVSEEDFDILYHLNDVRVEVHESNEIEESFEIVFHFTENKYFSNTRLWRKFNFVRDDVTSESSNISWINYEIPESYQGFFRFFESKIEYDDLKMAMCIKDRIWRNPLKYVRRYQAKMDGEAVESETDDEPEVESQVGSRYPFSWLF